MLKIGALLLLGLFLAGPVHAAMRCGNRLVNEGDRVFQVRERCGEPFWSESWLGVDILGRDTPIERQREVEWSVWYYNFGPRALMMRVAFVDGILRDTEALGYGVRRIGDSCRATMDFRGLSSGELVARCGEPASRRQARDSLVMRSGPHLERWREQRREEGVYDFGDTRFLRVLDLVDGRVTSTRYVALNGRSARGCARSSAARTSVTRFSAAAGRPGCRAPR